MDHVWIIIVNYRTAGLVVDCLRALVVQATDLRGGRVVIVDNDSRDGSVEVLDATINREGWSEWAVVIPLDRNGGFAYGNNAGIREALLSRHRVDYIMLLNPDTIPRPGAVRALVAFMDSHPRAGIAGSLLENPDGGLENSAHRIHSPLSELDSGARLGLLSRLLRRYVVWSAPSIEAHQCDWVSGASLIIRREVIDRLGMMDDGYFLYFEEADYCWRAKQTGWEIWYVPESRVMHLEGASTGIHAASKRRARYWYDSRRRFFVKHHGISGLILADLLWFIGRVSYLLRCLLRLGARAQDPKWFMFDLLWGDLLAIVTGRARLSHARKEP